MFLGEKLSNTNIFHDSSFVLTFDCPDKDGFIILHKE